MNWFFIKNKDSIIIFISVVFLFAIASWITGYIPVNNGAGWDGDVYLHYAKILAVGGDISGDPYREIRMPNFFPIIFLLKVGVSSSQIITIQAVLNAVLLAASASLLYSTLLILKLERRVSMLSIAALVFTWPFIVMPVFYPILSDHAALAISCLCLWCWSKSMRWMLCVISAASLWVIPGLFLVPLILSAFPLRIQSETIYKYKTSLRIVATIIVSICVVVLISPSVLNIPQDKILDHASNQGGVTAMIELRSLSLFSMIAAVFFIVWIYINLISDLSIWRSISYKLLIFSSASTIASGYFMYSSIDWSSGFVGPPLLMNMMMQSLALPFKPLVSHFLNLTPIIILALIIIARCSLAGKKNIPVSLLVLFSAFMPFIFFGSESRQWLGILPVVVTIFAIAEFSFLQRIWCLLVSIVIILPAFWLNEKTVIALQSGSSFQSNEWQFYFGRQGPWMSVYSYGFGAASIVFFVAVHFFLNRFSLDKRTAIKT